MNNKAEEPEDISAKHPGRRTYVTATTGVSLSSKEKSRGKPSSAGLTAEKDLRKVGKTAMAAKTSGRNTRLLWSLASEADGFISMNVRVHPDFKQMVSEDAKQSRRSLNQQLMVGYLTYRSLSPTTLRKRAALLGRLGAWINDHDVPEAERQAFAEILLETQAAFGGE